MSNQTILSSKGACPGYISVDFGKNGIVNSVQGYTPNVPLISDGRPAKFFPIPTVDILYAYNIGHPPIANISSVEGAPSAPATQIPVTGVPTQTFSIASSSADVHVSPGQTARVTFTVARSGDLALGGTVYYITRDITAVADSDFVPQRGVLTFLPGESTKQFDVEIMGSPDSFETGRQFDVVLYGAPALSTTGPASIIKIINDGSGATPTSFFSVGAAQTGVGQGQTRLMTFVVTRSGDLSKTASVNYSTQDVTAVSGTEYYPVAGTLTFNPNQSTATVPIYVLPGIHFDEDKYVALQLTGTSAGSAVKSGGGLGTITDDDKLTYYAKVGMSLDQFQERRSSLEPLGLQLVDLSVIALDAAGTIQQASALWKLSPTPAPTIAEVWKTSPEIDSLDSAYKASGYSISRLFAFRPGAGVTRYSAIWKKDSTRTAIYSKDVSISALPSIINSMSAQGYQPTDIAGYDLNGADTYSIVWEKVTNRLFKVAYGQTQSQLSSLTSTYNQQGYQMQRVSQYSFGVALKYGAIWEARSTPISTPVGNMTGLVFCNTLSSNSQAGKNMISLGSSLSSGALNYVSIWAK